MKAFTILLISLCSLVLFSCSSDTPPAQFSAEVTADKDTAYTSEQVGFTAQANRDADHFLWKVDGRSSDTAGWTAGSEDTSFTFSTAGKHTVFVKAVASSESAPDSVTVVVVANPISITLTPSLQVLDRGATAKITASIKPVTVDSILWKIGGTIDETTGWHVGDKDSYFCR